jgi:hypothetical protein
LNELVDDAVWVVSIGEVEAGVLAVLTNEARGGGGIGDVQGNG